jgi:5-oxoprolinase (ATP-hydrolysing) subunit C
MSFLVVDPGQASRLVDLGRPGSRALGVSVGGAADRAAFMLGNALVGNVPAAPALEVCLRGPVLRAEAQIGCVVFGAPFTVASSGHNFKLGTTFTLEAGEDLNIGSTGQGMRAYLCVRGGFHGSIILDSASALENPQAGDQLRADTGCIRRRSFSPTVMEELATERLLVRAIPGLQADWFANTSFYDQQFAVTPTLDRMGIRLESSPLPYPERELVSEPVCPGAVQVTRDGQCIVLGVDCQTIGGYPKIAQVIQADLDKLAQLRPGDSLRFQKVSLEEAVALYRRRQGFLRLWGMRASVSLDGC